MSDEAAPVDAPISDVTVSESKLLAETLAHALCDLELQSRDILVLTAREAVGERELDASELESLAERLIALRSLMM